MKKALVLLLGVWFVALLIGSVAARDVANPGVRPVKALSESENPMLNADPGLRGLYEEAAVDTYCIVWYTFDNPAAMNWQGWTRLDNTGQMDTFFHVDDFAGLGGGKGNLYALEGGTGPHHLGGKSMWCGARPNITDPYLCKWATAPGYGSNWFQLLKTNPITIKSPVTWSYKMFYESEGGWDFTRVEYDAGGVWQEAARYSDIGDTVAVHVLRLTQLQTKLRFHFTSDDNTNDEDGRLNTDGGCIIDSIRVADGNGLINYENFESGRVGATTCGIWIGIPESGYGSFAGLKTGLVDKDPCGDDFTTQVVYFIGSPVTSTSYPGLYDTPFCTGPGQRKAPCQNETIVSPQIDMKKYSTAPNNVQNANIPAGDLPQLGGTLFRYQVYRDLPQDNLVYYQWGVRIIDTLGCAGNWVDRGFVYYGPDMDYLFTGENLSDILATNQPVQMNFGVIDMADIWYPSKGTGDNHTPTPWFDQIRLYRYKTTGPQWAVRDLDLFQDNFPDLEDNIESFVRADAANDILPDANTSIQPGDSIVVDCTSLLGGGIGTDPTFGGPAVYMHVLVTYTGAAPVKPALSGARLAGWTNAGVGGIINFNYVGMEGAWTIIQCDSAQVGNQIVLDKWMVDLNDTLFTRGYKIEYYFTAKDAGGATSALPRWAHKEGPYYEFECLPGLNSDVLFVDDFTGRGSFVGSVETYWMPVFDAVLQGDNAKVDKYDVNGPTSGVSNGPGSRAKQPQIQEYYNKIVWDCGDLESYTISDGAHGDKSPDCRMLIDWMEGSSHTCGLWVCGDDIAYELDGQTGDAQTLMGDWCGVDFIATSYFEATGGRPNGIVNPLITGDTDAQFGYPLGDAIFVHSAVKDQFFAYGGCFIINQFDVLGKTANGKYAASYPLYGGTPRYAAIASSKLNTANFNVNTMWFGFSYMYVRDNVQGAPQDRFELARDVFSWMQNAVNVNVTPAETPKSTKLAQNFPNPFNPSTTIKFDLKDKGFVTLKVYNVAGQLIRTLVSGVKDANTYTITWDGTNDRGGAVASGIYFYKMDTKDFSQTKKMVMLR